MKLLLAFLGPELRANTYQKQYCPIQYSYNRLSCSISALTPENCRNDRKMDDFLDFSDSEDDSESETLFESWFDKESIPQAKKWDFDVFKFSKENSLFLVKFAGFVLGKWFKLVKLYFVNYYLEVIQGPGLGLFNHDLILPEVSA